MIWFVMTIITCGAHAIYLRSWQRERRQQLAWWQNYDAESQRRHEAFMNAVEDRSNRERGQA